MPDMASMGVTVPAFLAKLWKIVDDPETDDLISWNPTGQSFVIVNVAKFTQELLPKYYKHNNLASFIRQLNMYGFHKVTSIESGGLKSEKDSTEFSHTCFVKGHPYLMKSIKRKLSASKTQSSITATFVKELEKNGNDLAPVEAYATLLAEINSMKAKQAQMDAKLKTVKHENESLWRELAIYRQKHLTQEQIMNRLINFIVRMVSNRNIPLRKLPLMLSDVDRSHKATTSPRGPTICELDDLLYDGGKKRGNDRSQVPFLTHDPDEESEPPYSVMGPEDEVYNTQQSPWLLSESTDDEAMPTVNPKLVSLANTYFANSDEPKSSKLHVKTKPVDSPKKDRKILGAKRKTSRSGNNKGKKDIIQESINRINLSPSDLASPSSSKARDPEEFEEASQSNENILKILQDVASQPTPTPTPTPTSQPAAQDFVQDTFQEDIDPLTLALLRPNTGNMADDVASKIPAIQISQRSNLAQQSGYFKELGSHVDTVQNDLDVLKEFLKGDTYNLDANTLLELFNDDPLSLIMTPTERDDSKEANNELIMYNSSPNVLDLAEVYGSTTATKEPGASSSVSLLSPSILETPVRTPATPSFPSPKKRRF